MKLIWTDDSNSPRLASRISATKFSFRFCRSSVEIDLPWNVIDNGSRCVGFESVIVVRKKLYGPAASSLLFICPFGLTTDTYWWMSLVIFGELAAVDVDGGSDIDWFGSEFALISLVEFVFFASNARLIDSFNSIRDTGGCVTFPTILFGSEVELVVLADGWTWTSARSLVISVSVSTFCRFADGEFLSLTKLVRLSLRGVFSVFVDGNRLSRIWSCSKIMSPLNECSSGMLYEFDAFLPFALISVTEKWKNVLTFSRRFQ